MLKRRKITRRILSNYQPSLKEKRNTSTVLFCRELKLFGDGYLKGAINVYTSELKIGVLAVSLEYFAYFLKLLLEVTANLGAIDMYVHMRDVAAITIIFDSSVIDDDIVRRMFKVAMKAGFVCARNEEVILLETAIHQDRLLEISSRNSLHFYRILRKIIVDGVDSSNLKRDKI